MSDPLLTLLGFLLVFAVLGAAEGLKRVGRVGEEGTRKFVHIGVGHWILLALAIRDVRWAVAAPLAFICLNYLSYRKGVFEAMERRDGAGGLGTVFYSVSLAVLVLVFFREPPGGDATHVNLRWAGVAGILTMAWGDGLAAVLGERWGTRTYSLTGARKSYVGSTAMFAASAAVLFLCARAAGSHPGMISIAGVAALATLLEAASPHGTDNLSVPIATALLFPFLLAS